MRAIGLACLVLLYGAGTACADALAECNQGRNAELHLRACSQIIAGAEYSPQQIAIAYRNRGNARADAGASGLRALDGAIAYYSQALLLAPATASLLVPIADAEDIGDARKGLTYAQEVCSGCHNILKTEAASPNKQAPPFRKVANTPGMTVTALTVWSRTTHPTMPNLVIEPTDMDNLIAYILSLRDRN